MGTMKSGKQINYSHGPAQTKQQVELGRNWNTFGAPMNHEKTQIHKIHHNSNLGEATTFPLIVFFMPSHEACTQMSFCLGTPKLES